ncbi:cytosolic sulfotransferase 5-like [Panicum miliaceum]|uniref:Sulfotransferase n=1 Tax=Panicum miliaceum TaxID=4540 RepID=A0A3L6RFI8_PANMI|nr:cytosolic sulfotransferase 5-like [Panicum miliaceum]
MDTEFIVAPFTGGEESGGIVQEVVKLCSFENLKKLPVNSSGVTDPIGGLAVGDWENYMTEEMAKKLDRIVEEKLGGCGLTF